MGARALYLSWPAVSQMSNFIRPSSKSSACVKKTAPIGYCYGNQNAIQGLPTVLSWNSGNSFLTNLD